MKKYLARHNFAKSSLLLLAFLLTTVLLYAFEAQMYSDTPASPVSSLQPFLRSSSEVQPVGRLNEIERMKLMWASASTSPESEVHRGSQRAGTSSVGHVFQQTPGSVVMKTEADEGSPQFGFLRVSFNDIDRWSVLKIDYLLLAIGLIGYVAIIRRVKT